MKYLQVYKIYESLVDKKIQLLKDLVVDLQDDGLIVNVINGCESFRLDYKKFIIIYITDFNKLFDRDLIQSKNIIEFNETLKSFGMKPRSILTGDHYCNFLFDKHGSMTNSPLLKDY